MPSRVRAIEPEQNGERRVTIRQEGTTAYLKVAYHAPAVTDARFYPLLVLDAALTGASGLNLWSSFRLPPAQRSARLYRALVERGLASAVAGALTATEHPFLYIVSVTATEGTALASAAAALLEELDRVRREGITQAEVAKAKAQLKARLVFDNDSITNIAHQLGYFETIAGVDVLADLGSRIAAVTLVEVAEAARAVLNPSSRTIGCFNPLPVSGAANSAGVGPPSQSFGASAEARVKRKRAEAKAPAPVKTCWSRAHPGVVDGAECRHAIWQLRGRRAHRRWRHGRSLSRPRYEAESRCRAEGPP